MLGTIVVVGNEVFIDNLVNFTISVFAWYVANDNEIYKKYE